MGYQMKLLIDTSPASMVELIKEDLVLGQLITPLTGYSAGRIKAGFTSRLDSRFSEHLMSAPTAKLIYSAPCQRAWETFMLAYVHSHGKKIRSEVFDILDVKILIKNLKTLFSQVGQRK